MVILVTREDLSYREKVVMIDTSIHSKSGPGDPNRAAKKFELSANLSKYATKWPKMTQNAPK